MKLDLKSFLESNEEWAGFVYLLDSPPDGDALRSVYPDVDREVCDKAWEMVNQFVTRSALYCLSRERGNNDRFAAIAAMQRPCRGMTDSVFNAGYPHFEETFGKEYADSVRAIWTAKGIPWTAQTNYSPFLAPEKGDEAGILDGRATVKRREERLSREPLIDPMEKAPRLANDLIVKCARDFAADNPDEARKMSKQEMKDHMIERHGRTK